MAIIYDPQNNETEALQRYASWQGKRVLELGCGDGRLTKRLAALGAIVDAYDPKEALIKLARETLPKKYAATIHFYIGQAETIDAPDKHYDLVLFSWSL